MEIARWNGHIFEVSSEVVRGFTGLSITGSTETEDTESRNTFRAKTESRNK